MSASSNNDIEVIEVNETAKKPVLRFQASRLSAPISNGIIKKSSFVGAKRTIEHRERAEIQLDSLLNEPEESLPSYVRQGNDQLGDEEIPLSEVASLLNTQQLVVERLVQVLHDTTKTNQDKLTSLNKSEIRKLTRILNSTIDVRSLIFFMMVDENGNDFITREGLANFYREYLKNLKTFDDERTNQVIQIVLQRFRLDQKTKIDYEDFYSIVSQDTILLEALSQFTVDPNWYLQSSQIKGQEKKANRIQNFFTKLCWQQRLYENHKHKLTIDYVTDNWTRILFILLYLSVNIGLLVWVCVQRAAIEKRPVFLVLARIGGMLLNWNCAVVIALMLKRIILLIRSVKYLRKLVPVDDHIDFHKFVGCVIAFFAIEHTIAHMINFGINQKYSWATLMFTTIPGIGWVGGFAPLSGVILCIILGVMVICSMKWIRRGGHFQVFYWTHLLYYPFFIFLIIHASNFWKWIIGPLVLFILEQLYGLTRYSSKSGRTYLESTTIEQSKVISLKIHRPKHFAFQPGDYININLPRVAIHEYHPFTISSAPEEPGYITVHIQAVGSWTKRVYQRFKDMPSSDSLIINRGDLGPGKINEATGSIQNSEATHEQQIESTNANVKKITKREPVLINGPYSSCARYVFNCKQVVLIGGGIGITPYASILSSLMAQFRLSRHVCSQCNHIDYDIRELRENNRLEKVDFIWVNRDQKNFEWFLNLLRQFEQEQEDYLAANSNEKRFLDIHLYFTEIKNGENIGNVPLDLVTKIWTQIAGYDIFTSLKSKTHIGRPKWNEIFDKLIENEASPTERDVNVFFCGPRTMGRSVQQLCLEYRFRFHEEKF